MRPKRFTAEIYAGHTTDCGVIVPFDPSAVWPAAKLLPIGYRKHVGYAVRGTVAGAPFESWIFHYASKWRMVVPGDAMTMAEVAPGDTAPFAVQPHPQPAEAPKFTPGPKRTTARAASRTRAQAPTPAPASTRAAAPAPRARRGVTRRRRPARWPGTGVRR